MPIFWLDSCSKAESTPKHVPNKMEFEPEIILALKTLGILMSDFTYPYTSWGKKRNRRMEIRLDLTTFIFRKFHTSF